MANTLEIIVQARDEASAQLGRIQASVNAMSAGLKNAGMIMVGAGAAITAAMGLAVKAAEEERIGIARLGAQLKNVGVSYDQVRGSLEAVITATQRKTGIADDQQREALGRLVMVTGDYQQSLNLLPLALDLAAAKQIDVATAGDLLGRVAMGNTSMLARYGIVLKEGATAAEALAAIQEKVAGTAEATANQFSILKAEMSDATEAIGAALVPLLKTVVTNLLPIIENFRKWIEQNPGLVKAIAMVGIALVVGGGSLLFALKAVSIALAVTQAMMGPAGWVALGIGVAAAAASIITINKLLEDNAAITTTATRATRDLSRAHGDWKSQARIVIAAAHEQSGATKALTQAQVELNDAQKKVLDQAKQVVDAYQYETSQAGILGVTVKDVQNVFLSMGGTEGALAAIMTALGTESGNVNAWLQMLGLTADAVDFKTRTLADSNNALSSTYSEMTKQILDDAAALQKQKDAQASLIEQAEEVVKAYQYETSEAGKLRITVQDVEFAYLQLGGTQEGLIESMKQLGAESNNVIAWLNLLGYSAKDVDAIMKLLQGTTNSVTASVSGESGRKASKSQVSVEEVQSVFQGLGGTKEWWLKFTEQLGAEAGNVNAWLKLLGYSVQDVVDLLAEQKELSRRQTPPPAWDSFQFGGIVPRTGLIYAHKGETVLPNNTTITIPIYLDGELISQKVIRNVADLAGRQRV